MKLIIIAWFASLVSAFSQIDVIDVAIKMRKKNHISGEHVKVDVLLKNRGAQDVRLHNKNGLNWLDFVITRNGGVEVPMAKRMLFADSVVPAGQQITRTVTLTLMYNLLKQGNYGIRARVLGPSDGAQPKFSRRDIFNVFGGSTIFKNQYGVKAKPGKVVEYRIKKLTTPDGSNLYLQVYDPKKQEIVVTYWIGKYTGIHQVQVKADDAGYLHVLFPADAKLFRYWCFLDNGHPADQRLIKQGGKGIPMLLKRADGKVGVNNGTIHDAEAERKKRMSNHNISQRPPFSYK